MLLMLPTLHSMQYFRISKFNVFFFVKLNFCNPKSWPKSIFFVAYLNAVDASLNQSIAARQVALNDDITIDLSTAFIWAM